MQDLERLNMVCSQVRDDVPCLVDRADLDRLTLNARCFLQNLPLNLFVP